MENATKGLLHYFNGSIIKALLYPIFGVIVLINIIIVIWEMGYLNKIKNVSLEERKQDLVISVQKIVSDFPENQPNRLNLILSNLTSNAIAEQIIVFNHQGIALASSRESALNQHMIRLFPVYARYPFTLCANQYHTNPCEYAAAPWLQLALNMLSSVFTVLGKRLPASSLHASPPQKPVLAVRHLTLATA